MPLAPGQRLGHYDILGPLDKGGMGEVYRARDPRLEREVAIKVLAAERAADPGWLDRFAREAKLLGSFSHEHIATLYGLEEADGVRFLVMELVPGQSLARRLERGPLPLAKALVVCQEIAEAVEAAHERGIVHRDLKPGNVMLTEQGRVKVLDFGLATQIETAPPSSVATTQTHHPATAAGQLLGTPSYMSPEQARAEPAEKRCDIWAFGCILFETLTGRRAFPGKTITAILAAVERDEPDWTALPPDTPRRLVGLLRRCLRKEYRDRLRDIGDARLEIEEILAEPKEQPPTPPRRRRYLPLALALSAALGAFALGLWLRAPGEQPPAGGGMRGEILIGGATRAFGPRVAPNGRRLAYITLHEGQAQVARLDLDTGEPRVLTHNRHGWEGVISLCWSPDSKEIFYDRFGVGEGPQRTAGICRISPDRELGPDDPEPRFIAGALCPQATSDGSLLVTRIEKGGNFTFWRHWLDGKQAGLAGRQVLAHPVQFNLTGEESWWPAPVRALRTRDEAVFCGRLLDGTPEPQRFVYRLDLVTGTTTPIYGPVLPSLVGLALTPDEKHVCVALQDHDGQGMVYVPLRDPRERPRVAFTLTEQVYGLDFDRDGNLYLDQFRRPPEVLRYLATGGEPERLTGMARGRAMQPVELPGGSVLLPGRVLGQDRLLRTRTGKEPTPLLEQETRPPVALVGKDRLAFVAGPEQEAAVVLARLTEGRADVLCKLAGVPTDGLTTLAGSHDGTRLYYIHKREVWELPLSDDRPDGPPRRLCAGDGVAVHPSGKEIVIQTMKSQGVQLFRVPLGGDAREVKPVGVRLLAPEMIGARAIDAEGRRVIVPVVSPGSWFWNSALLDLTTGQVAPIPVKNFEGDLYPSNWDATGKILSIACPVRSDLWRFTPLK